MKRLLALLLALFAGCSRCAEDKPVPKLASSVGAGQAAREPVFACAAKGDHLESCEEALVPFAAGDSVTVRLCRLTPRDEAGEAQDGVTRLELLQTGKSIGCGKLSDVASLSALCSGPAESACLARLAQDNLATSARFFAPRAYASSRLLLFFGDALDSDTPSVELIQVNNGAARTVFYSEAGKTERPFIFNKLEDVDGDGKPELLGFEAMPELDACQPYLPEAVFSLLGEGEVAKFVRNDALMEKRARAQGKEWHGPLPDPSVRVCEEDPADAQDDAAE